MAQAACVTGRVLDAPRHRRQRPEVVDDADAVHRLGDRRRVGQAAFDEFGRGVEVRRGSTAGRC